MKTKYLRISLLAVTTFAIIAKGIQYLPLGRVLPLAVATLPLLALILTLYRPGKAADLLCKTWTWLLLAWGAARLGLGLALLLPQTITENHVFEQFSPIGILITLGAIASGIVLLRPAAM